MAKGPLLSLIPRPTHPPVPLLKLYQKHTKDLLAPEELVRCLVRQDTDSRILVISLVMKGYSHVQISGALGITKQSVLEQVQRSMKRVWKIVNKIPRYHVRGHGGGNKRNLINYKEKV